MPHEEGDRTVTEINFLPRRKDFGIFWSPIAGIAQLVERNLAKVDVAGSSPVSRSVPLPDEGEGTSGNQLSSTLNVGDTSSMNLPRCPKLPPGNGVFFVPRGKLVHCESRIVNCGLWEPGLMIRSPRLTVCAGPFNSKFSIPNSQFSGAVPKW